MNYESLDNITGEAVRYNEETHKFDVIVDTSVVGYTGLKKGEVYHSFDTTEEAEKIDYKIHNGGAAGKTGYSTWLN